MVQAVAPPGWPRPVVPAGVHGWEDSATAWLFDVSPPEFRSYPVLRRHPVVLVRFALTHAEAGLQASRSGLGEVRTSLRDHAEPETVDLAVVTWEREIARLLALRRSVGLVEEALRGRRFRPRL
ncbi:MAG: hypothetical protein M3510_13685 [Actinomycetota bacterium]|nr:hypothetical protein [Actinomycetota bacterium]